MDRLDSIPQPWKIANTLPNKMKKEGPTSTDRQMAELQNAQAEPRQRRQRRPETTTIRNMVQRSDKCPSDSDLIWMPRFAAMFINTNEVVIRSNAAHKLGSGHSLPI